jgi:hypothetical protein
MSLLAVLAVTVPILAAALGLRTASAASPEQVDATLAPSMSLDTHSPRLSRIDGAIHPDADQPAPAGAATVTPTCTPDGAFPPQPSSAPSAPAIRHPPRVAASPRVVIPLPAARPPALASPPAGPRVALNPAPATRITQPGQPGTSSRPANPPPAAHRPAIPAWLARPPVQQQAATAYRPGRPVMPIGVLVTVVLAPCVITVAARLGRLLAGRGGPARRG